MAVYTDRQKIIECIERLRERDNGDKGAQPELVLGCFLSLESKGEEYCKQCTHYENTCKNYLSGFRADTKSREVRTV